MTIDAAEAVRRVIAADAPVLFLDTCSLLDVMRDPTREKFGARHAGAAIQLLARAEASPPTVSILLPQQVVTELTEHASGIECATEQAIGRLDATLERTYGIFGSYGIALPSARPILSTLGYPAQARTIVDRFVRASHIVGEEDAYVTRAWQRVRRGVAPAARAKQSVKDCVILETCLHVAQELRSSGFGRTILFFTTNTADYTEGARPRLHSQLDSDFSSVAMSFASEFLAAKYAL